MAIEDNNPIDNEEVDVEEEVTVNFDEDGEEVDVDETETPEEDFFANIAEDMDERVLDQLSNDLIADYEKDRESRKDWEDGYLKGLDLLGFKFIEQNRPFRGAAGVTHPLLAEAVTQF